MNNYFNYGRPPYDSPVSPCPCQSNKISDLPAGVPLAMCYVPTQSWQNLYDPARALCIGTLFEELNKPFLGGHCR